MGILILINNYYILLFFTLFKKIEEIFTKIGGKDN